MENEVESYAVYGGTPKMSEDKHIGIVTNADKKANTPAYQTIQKKLISVTKAVIT